MVSATVIATIRRCAVGGAVVALLLTGCDGRTGDEVPTTWDLRDDTTVGAVGWPEDEERSSWEVDPVPEELTVLLPEDVELPVGSWEAERIEVGRLHAPGARELTRIAVVLPRGEPVAARARADGIAEAVGLDVDRIHRWVADPTRGEGTVTTPSVPLGAGDTTWGVSLRLVPGGDADDADARLRLLLVPADVAQRVE
jgi:hypothetical protein